MEKREFKKYGVIDILLGEYVLNETSQERRKEIDQELRAMHINTSQQLSLHGYDELAKSEKQKVSE